MLRRWLRWWRRSRRLALALVVGGCAAITAGVILLQLAAGLIVGGALAVAVGLLVIDVEAVA